MKQITETFKLLSDETRLRIIMLLNQEKLCVCQLCGILKQPQPRISKNLAKLRDMNIVKDERKEKFIYYSLTQENKTLINIIELISNKVKEYPQLAEDRKRINQKEKYLSQCGIQTEKNNEGE